MADPQVYTAFLIGSWDHDPDRKVRYGENGTISKKIDKKRGIRKTTWKGKEVANDEWVKGDLRVMEEFMDNRNIETFRNIDYRERDPITGRYAIGKYQILRELAKFFKQPYKTHFILYFTGHGDVDGSWCFPVTIRNLDPVTPPHPGPAHSPRPQQPGMTAEGTIAATPGVVTLEETGGEAVVMYPQQPGMTAEGTTPAATPGIVTLEETGGEAVVHPMSADSPDTEEPCPKPIEQSRLTQSIESLCPDPTKELYDLLTFEDIVQLWDSYKMVRKRYLMLVLDCCHSGRWVQMVNGEITRGDQGEGNDSTATEASTPMVYTKRDDICVQAACRPSEESAVAKNQMGSIFTSAYTAAQNRGLAKNLALTAIDHVLVLNVASIVASSHSIFDSSRRFTPMSTPSPNFNGFKFFDSFDDMHLNTS